MKEQGGRGRVEKRASGEQRRPMIDIELIRIVRERWRDPSRIAKV